MALSDSSGPNYSDEVVVGTFFNGHVRNQTSHFVETFRIPRHFLILKTKVFVELMWKRRFILQN